MDLATKETIAAVDHSSMLDKKYQAFVVFALLPAYVAGQLMSTEAKCLAGYEWAFNTLNQGPCDVAASLAAVCAPDKRFNLDSLPLGYVYTGPYRDFATRCRCSTVYYSMLSACGYCQSRNYVNWSTYHSNCTTVFVQVYPETIPSGVNIPAWAYLNVLDGDQFNVPRAQQTRGTESSRTPNLSTSAVATSPSLLPSSTPKPELPRSRAGAIGGGVIGIIIFLGLIIGLSPFFSRWKRSLSSARQLASTTSKYRNMGLTPDPS